MKHGLSAPAVVSDADTAPVGCEIGALFSILAKPHMLHILHEFLVDPPHGLRFGELRERLGLAPKTLSTRLKSLVEAGLLVRKRYNEIPPRVEYEVTGTGRKLADLFRFMERWANENSLHAAGTVSPGRRT